MKLPFGKDRAAECNICFQGKFIVLKDDHNHIDELCCNHCFTKFVALERGKGIAKMLDDQLEGFKNPETPPEKCPRCGNKELARCASRISLDSFPKTRYDPNDKTNDDWMREHYLCCTDCLTVLFHEPKKDGPFGMHLLPPAKSDPALHIDDIRPNRKRKS